MINDENDNENEDDNEDEDDNENLFEGGWKFRK